MEQPTPTPRISMVSSLGTDGSKLGLRFEFADGVTKDGFITSGDAAKLIALVLRELTESAPTLPPGSPGTISLPPIPARTIGSGTGPAGEQLLGVDLGLFQLVFLLPPGTTM